MFDSEHPEAHFLARDALGKHDCLVFYFNSQITFSFEQSLLPRSSARSFHGSRSSLIF
jgi:hypothetical protein